MRILLDENIRASFADYLEGHEVKHVDQLGFKSLANGELLKYARQNFDALLTLDRGILHQHNHTGEDLRILVIRVQNSTIESLLRRLEDIKTWLDQSQPGNRSEV